MAEPTSRTTTMTEGLWRTGPVDLTPPPFVQELALTEEHWKSWRQHIWKPSRGRPAATKSTKEPVNKVVSRKTSTVVMKAKGEPVKKVASRKTSTVVMKAKGEPVKKVASRKTSTVVMKAKGEPVKEVASHKRSVDLIDDVEEPVKKIISREIIVIDDDEEPVKKVVPRRQMTDVLKDTGVRVKKVPQRKNSTVASQVDGGNVDRRAQATLMGVPVKRRRFPWDPVRVQVVGDDQALAMITPKVLAINKDL